MDWPEFEMGDGLKSKHPDDAAAFDRALELRAAGRLREAVIILESLCEQHPKHAPVHGVLGLVYWDLGELQRARKSLETTANVSPRSQLASIALASVMVEMGDLREARGELTRYLASAESDQHRAKLEQVERLLRKRAD